MKQLWFFLCLTTILSELSCKNSSDNITVLMENNSDMKPIIEIITNVNDTYYAKHVVKRNKEKVSYTEFTITKPVKWDVIKLKFFINGEMDTTLCSVIKNSVKKNTTVHVNFNEVLFKKGDSYKGYVLDKDTIIKREFYSEFIY